MTAALAHGSCLPYSASRPAQEHQLWHYVHAPFTKDNLPPDNVLLSDGDAAAIILLAHKDDLDITTLHKRWPTTFGEDGCINHGREPIGMPGIAYHSGETDGKAGYYYLSCPHHYVFCGGDFYNKIMKSDKDKWAAFMAQNRAAQYPCMIVKHRVVFTLDLRCAAVFSAIEPPMTASWPHVTEALLRVCALKPFLLGGAWAGSTVMNTKPADHAMQLAQREVLRQLLMYPGTWPWPVHTGHIWYILMDTISNEVHPDNLDRWSTFKLHPDSTISMTRMHCTADHSAAIRDAVSTRHDAYTKMVKTQISVVQADLAAVAAGLPRVSSLASLTKLSQTMTDLHYETGKLLTEMEEKMAIEDEESEEWGI